MVIRLVVSKILGRGFPTPPPEDTIKLSKINQKALKVGPMLLTAMKIKVPQNRVCKPTLNINFKFIFHRYKLR